MKKLLGIAIFSTILSCVALPSFAATGPCAVVTTAEASRALGRPVVQTRERDFSHESCSYKSADLSAFIVTIERFASSSEARNEYRASIESSATQQLPSVKLSGVGDAAQRLGSTVLVLKRNWVYGFTLVAPDANSAGAQRVLKVVAQITPRL